MFAHDPDGGARSPRRRQHRLARKTRSTRPAHHPPGTRTLITHGVHSRVYETDTLRQVSGPPLPLPPGTRLLPTTFVSWERPDR